LAQRASKPDVTQAAVLSRWLVVTLVLFVASCTAPLPLPERPDIPFGEGRIWQAERPGQPVSWLFGTMHVTDPRVFDLPEAVESAFERADIAVFEVDYLRRSSRKELNRHFDLPEGQVLEEVVGHDTYRDLRELMRTQLLPYWEYSRRQPWVAWMAISDRQITVDIQNDPERLVLDDWLLVRARKARKGVAFLETDSEQWQAFSGIPMEDQVSMLRSAIDSYYGSRTRVEAISLYLEGDLALRYALWKRSLSDLDPVVAELYHRRIIEDRNQTMVERMLPLMEDSSIFVAVGAMHMPGEEGVLRTLEKRGYTITRLH
jgi:uncharacterized protein